MAPSTARSIPKTSITKGRVKYHEMLLKNFFVRASSVCTRDVVLLKKNSLKQLPTPELNATQHSKSKKKLTNGLDNEDEGMAQIGSPKHSHEEKSTSKTASNLDSHFESTEEDISEGSTDDRVESINSTNNVDHDLGFTGNNVLNGSSPEMTQSFLDSYGVAEASIIPAEEELDRPPTPIVPNPEDLAIDKEEAERLAKLDTIRKEVVYLQSKLQKYDQAMDDALKALRKKFVEDKAELKETHALQCSEISATLDERRQQQIELTTSSITRLSEKIKAANVQNPIITQRCMVLVEAALKNGSAVVKAKNIKGRRERRKNEKVAQEHRLILRKAPELFKKWLQILETAPKVKGAIKGNPNTGNAAFLRYMFNQLEYELKKCYEMGDGAFNKFKNHWQESRYANELKNACSTNV